MESTRGILNPGAALTRFELTRRSPHTALAPFVDFYWIVRWDLVDGRQHLQQVLPHPSVHLVFQQGRSGIHGVMRIHRERLEGAGQVFGVRFRAGGFRSFFDRPVSAITDRILPVHDVFGVGGLALQGAVLREPDDARRVTLMDEFLCSAAPAPDPLAEAVGSIVEQIAADPALTRVDQVARRCGTSPRRLQRLFAEYVGVSPKWVIQRYRLHEAAERLERQSVTAVAADLGYADHAHLTRDFRSAVGASPSSYARECAEASAQERQ